MAVIIGTVGGVWGVSGAGVVGAGLAYEIWLLILPGIVVDVNLLGTTPSAQQEAVDKWCLICNSVATGVGAHWVLHAQSIEAATQAVYLKDRLTATNTVLANTNANLATLTSQLTALVTVLGLAQLDDSMVNANILTMITAWQTMNIGLSAPDPTGSGVAAALAVAIFTDIMTNPLTGLVAGTLVPSWTSLVASHTARGATITGQLAGIASVLALVTADIAAIALENPLLGTVTLPTSDGVI